MKTLVHVPDIAEQLGIFSWGGHALPYLQAVVAHSKSGLLTTDTSIAATATHDSCWKL
jgi:hypothetical protein